MNNYYSPWPNCYNYPPQSGPFVLFTNVLPQQPGGYYPPDPFYNPGYLPNFQYQPWFGTGGNSYYDPQYYSAPPCPPQQPPHQNYWQGPSQPSAYQQPPTNAPIPPSCRPQSTKPPGYDFDNEVAVINGVTSPPILTDKPAGQRNPEDSSVPIIRPSFRPPGSQGSETVSSCPPTPPVVPPRPPNSSATIVTDGSKPNNTTAIVSAIGGLGPDVVKPLPDHEPPPIKVRLPDEVYDRCCGCYRQPDKARCMRPAALALSIFSLIIAPPFLSIPAVIFACRKPDLPHHANKYQRERRKRGYRTSIILALIGIMIGFATIITIILVIRYRDPNMYNDEDIRYSVRGFDGTATCWCKDTYASDCSCQVERGSLYRHCHCDGYVCDCPTINVSG